MMNDIGVGVLIGILLGFAVSSFGMMVAIAKLERMFDEELTKINERNKGVADGS